VKAPPEPPGVTRRGDGKKRIASAQDDAGQRERERERERERGGGEGPNGIFGEWNEGIKGFSVIANRTYHRFIQSANSTPRRDDE